MVKFWGPWREENSHLPGNYNLSYRRLNDVVKKENLDMLKMYRNVIKDQLRTRVKESVDDNSIQGENIGRCPNISIVEGYHKSSYNRKLCSTYIHKNTIWCDI